MDICYGVDTSLLIGLDLGCSKTGVMEQHPQGFPIVRSHRLYNDSPTPVSFKTVNQYSVSLKKLPHFLCRCVENLLKVKRLADAIAHDCNELFLSEVLSQSLFCARSLRDVTKAP